LSRPRWVEPYSLQMETIAIVGVGLIGGSLGLALRKAGFSGRILGVSSERTVAAAVARGAIDEGVTLEAAAARADLVYLAQPISGIIDSLDRLAPLAGPGMLVTDAGSTKSAIVRKASEALSKCQFLGGHPMAGKESRGVESADADLFQGRTYVLTPGSASELETPPARTLVSWINRIGSTLVTMSPEEHDTTVAFTSHLPQIASTALASVLATLRDEQLPVAGQGVVDMTRLALSSFEIWYDILSTNRDAVDHALAVYIDKLTEMRNTLHTQQLGNNFKVAAGAAIKLRGGSINRQV
jgi:prephenate dehydrogenase